jgi:hypothetical protein
MMMTQPSDAQANNGYLVIFEGPISRMTKPQSELSGRGHVATTQIFDILGYPNGHFALAP